MGGILAFVRLSIDLIQEDSSNSQVGSACCLQFIMFICKSMFCDHLQHLAIINPIMFLLLYLKTYNTSPYKTLYLLIRSSEISLYVKATVRSLEC